MKGVFIDSDIFVRDLRYPRDQKSGINGRFLEQVQRGKIKGITSYFNLLEICGVLSFNYTTEDLMDLYSDFINHFRVKVFYPSDAEGNFQYDLVRIFERIKQKQALGDAQVAYVVERFSNLVSAFVSWNARHFDGKLSVPVMTPEEFLKV